MMNEINAVIVTQTVCTHVNETKWQETQTHSHAIAKGALLICGSSLIFNS